MHDYSFKIKPILQGNEKREAPRQTESVFGERSGQNPRDRERGSERASERKREILQTTRFVIMCGFWQEKISYSNIFKG